MFPEATQKEITLKDYFYNYFDFGKEFHTSFHPDQELESLSDILDCILCICNKLVFHLTLGRFENYSGQ